ncbi:MAG: hypothetical protein KF690_04385 [Bacteroidetes bacterium]|nr:hypothetical protein [Bacteroidota bacterium]
MKLLCLLGCGRRRHLAQLSLSSPFPGVQSSFAVTLVISGKAYIVNAVDVNQGDLGVYVLGSCGFSQLGHQ